MEGNNLRPSVIPSQAQKIEAEERAKLVAFEESKKNVTKEVYSNVGVTEGQMDAVEMMRRRTEEQLRIRESAGYKSGVVKDESLAEKTPQQLKYEEQLRLRDEQLAMNKAQINTFQERTLEATNRKQETKNMESNNQGNGGYVPPKPPTKEASSYGENPSNINPFIIELSQPNYNTSFDVIPLPSKGKLYKDVKQSVRVSFMTTADENILTSPNLLQSGQFLEILINRKLLEQNLRYRDLHVGDRNAIMIWLRATGYGEMYPVTLLDENNIPFDTEINLHDLKIKNLSVEPDSEGLFDFIMPISKVNIKFKLLSCGDVDDIEAMVDADKESGNPVNNSSTYKLEKSIVEVNGNRNREDIRMFIDAIRILDTKKLNDYIDSIESGLDLNIEIKTPGGGSIKTFLPLNVNFFWPNFGL
jgi:hypothetical protein